MLKLVSKLEICSVESGIENYSLFSLGWIYDRTENRADLACLEQPVEFFL